MIPLVTLLLLVESCWCIFRGNGCSDGSVWLVNGASELEGMVEFYLRNSSNTSRSVVCAIMGEETANEICNRLGFSKYGAEIINDQFGRTQASSYTIECDDSENCSCSSTTTLCVQASIRCQQRRCEEWDLRSTSNMQSILSVSEVCVKEDWIPIAESSTGVASVLCRQLGMSIYGVNETTRPLSAVDDSSSTSSKCQLQANCSGSEHHISQCNNNVSDRADRVSNFTCKEKCHLCRGGISLSSPGVIVGLVFGSIVFVAVIITLILFQVALGTQYKKRRYRRKKTWKQKAICANLNSVLSRSCDAGINKAAEAASNMATAPSIQNIESALATNEIVTSQCVAYTAATPSKQAPVVSYEDVPL